jgi:II/X family phage/plasmid replication protein
MIDWITAYIPAERFTDEDRETLRLLSDRVIRFCPSTGTVRYETAAWDSVRSDSHSVVCRYSGVHLWVQGSPARVIGDGDTVFSSGASKAEDLGGCLDRMLSFLYGALKLQSPPALEHWEVTRIDITRNLALATLAEVRQFLSFLRNAEGGRLRVNQPDGDTVYWNKTSRYKKGKAYAKGPHLRYIQKKPDYKGRRYSDDELLMADKLIRLELTIFRRYWQKNLNIKTWRDLTPKVLDTEWHAYFDLFIGQTIMNDEELKQRIYAVVPRLQSGEVSGQAKAAYNCWWLIKSMGWEMARDNQTKSTWYRNLSILKKAGLKVTDLGNGKVIPFRVQKVISGYRVSSWDELRKAA